MVRLGVIWISRTLMFLQLLQGILAWGSEGHYAICKIAEGFLNEDAASAVKVLLPEYAEGDLAAVCSWADEIRHTFHWHWSGPLHYVDTPDFRCNYKYRRDCHDSAGHEDRCVTGAIYNYTMQLKTYHDSVSQWKYNLTEALMFLSHFIGDVHQPLHVGFTGDLGGNTITVRWYRRKTNLHHVWDTMIIESALKILYDWDLSIMIEALEGILRKIGHRTYHHGRIVYQKTQFVQIRIYASESVNLACKFAYRNASPGSTLSDDYFFSRLPVVEKRLAQSGIRLAATLNRIFSTKPSISLA